MSIIEINLIISIYIIIILSVSMFTFGAILHLVKLYVYLIGKHSFLGIELLKPVNKKNYDDWLFGISYIDMHFYQALLLIPLINSILVISFLIGESINLIIKLCRYIRLKNLEKG